MTNKEVNHMTITECLNDPRVRVSAHGDLAGEEPNRDEE